jgi:large subunit ribosomal protein L15
MNVNSIPSVPGAMKRRKIVGRGVGSGHGKTSTRGQKGQRARTGKKKKPGFEGSRNPLIRRLPKRGFKRKATTQPEVIEILNVGQLNRFSEGSTITPELLKQEGIIRNPEHLVKLLADGEVSKKITISVHQASAAAVEKLNKAGCKLTLITKSNNKKA